MNKIARNRGFTLIEILVVIAIIAILAAIVIVAVNPAKRFRESANAQRLANITAITSAIGMNVVDNKGTFTKDTACNTEVAKIDGSDKAIGTGAVDLSRCLVDAYLAKLPIDSATGFSDANTGYTIRKTSAGGYTVCAPETVVVATGVKVATADVPCVTR